MWQSIITNYKCLFSAVAELRNAFSIQNQSPHQKIPQQNTPRNLMSACTSQRHYAKQQKNFFAELCRPSNRASTTIPIILSFTIYILYSRLKTKCLSTYQSSALFKTADHSSSNSKKKKKRKQKCLFQVSR